MSTPITACLFVAAAKDEPGAFDRLISRATENAKFGACSFYGCRCEPPCEPPTDEQEAAFIERLATVDKKALCVLLSCLQLNEKRN